MGLDLGGLPLSREGCGLDGKITKQADLDPTLPIVIIGAGIAGLTLAQGLQQAGVPFEIYEEERTTRKTAIPDAINCHVHYAKRLESFQIRSEDMDVVQATFSDDEIVTGSMLVGADGRWSTVRTLLLGEEESDDALQAWSTHDGRITLIGDAAHPVAMDGSEKSIHASRDGKMLADCLVCAWTGVQLQQTVCCYEAEMRERTLLSVVMNSPKIRQAYESDKAQQVDDTDKSLDRCDSGVSIT